MFQGNSLVWQVCGMLQKTPLRMMWSLFGGLWDHLVPSVSNTSHPPQVHEESHLSLSSLFIGASEWQLKSLVQFFPYISFCSQVLALNKLSSAQRRWNVVSNSTATANFSWLSARGSTSPSEWASGAARRHGASQGAGFQHGSCTIMKVFNYRAAAGILIIQHTRLLTPSTGVPVPIKGAEVHDQCSP